MSKPILIAGAGPVGLTLACELVRHGLDVRIVERKARATDKSKALVLWPRTLELLEKAGMVKPFLVAGTPIAGISIFENPEKRLAHVTFDDLKSPFPYVLGLPQYATERLLSERLKDLGVEVERCVEVVSLEQHDLHVTVNLRHPDGRTEITETSWLPACDGARSTVRHQLGVRLEGETVEQEFAMIDCDVAGLPFYDEVVAFTSSLGLVAFFPIAPPRTRIICLRVDCSGQANPPEPTLEEMEQELISRGLGHLRISNPHWLAAFRINERHAKRYRYGRVLLAGDSAHVHSPVGGQGMNTGMQDAFNLAWKLALVEKGQVPESWVDSYSQERQPVGAAVVEKTGKARQIITLRHPVATAVRNKLMSLLTSFDFVRHKITEEASELAIKYPHSPLNREVHQGHSAWLLGQGIHPGDRAPDGALARGSIFTRIFDLMQDTRFHLVLLSGVSHKPLDGALACANWASQHFGDSLGVHWIGHQAENLPQLPSAWWDETTTIHKEYGAADPTLYLIRPDGYVAFRCQPASRPDLEKYLTDMGIRAPQNSEING